MHQLINKTVFISRDKLDAMEFVEPLEREGARVIGAPLITTQYWELSENEKIMNRLSQFDWIIFTSHNGVQYFMELAERLNVDPIDTIRSQIAAVGSKTKKTLEKYGFTVSFVPTVFDAENFVQQFLALYKPKYPLLVKGNLSRKVIDDTFDLIELPYEKLYVYQTKTNVQVDLIERLRHNAIDAVSFTSPSTIDALLHLYKDDFNALVHLPCFCIGKTTETRALEVGFRKTYVPEEYTLEGLAHLVKDSFERGIV